MSFEESRAAGGTDESGWVDVLTAVDGALQINPGPITVNGTETLEVYTLRSLGVVAYWLVEFKTPTGAIFRVLVEQEAHSRAIYLAWEVLNVSPEDIGDPRTLMVRARELQPARQGGVPTGTN